MLECVVNVSEGRDAAVLRRLDAVAGPDLLDRHSDPHHHRSVLTLVGEAAPRAVAEEAVRSIDLRRHTGVHPRLGVVDVVPFVPLEGSAMTDAVRARDEFATWMAEHLQVPCFLYGAERSLPDVRRHAFVDLAPEAGPPRPHPSAGATAVGARPVLVAFNVWVTGGPPAAAQAVARRARGTHVRALGLVVGDRLQVSMNLIDPGSVGPLDAYEHVARLAADEGLRAEGAELVGVVPEPVLSKVPRSRWAELDLSEERTIEARLALRGSGG